jgi:transposase InsO family protein
VLADGVSCGLHRIERLMRRQALRARLRGRRLSSDQGERQGGRAAPNVLERSFNAPAPYRRWIADFTYIWTAEGWLYVQSRHRHAAKGRAWFATSSCMPTKDLHRSGIDHMPAGVKRGRKIAQEQDALNADGQAYCRA